MNLTGQTLRGYTLRDALGTGGFGTVYRGWQEAVGREVAVKAIRAELADDPSFVRRFEREAQTIARLEHPHIIPLYDFWREPGGAYLVMRLMRGGSLAAKQGLERTELVRMLREVADAIDNAHRKGVIHRDIKPSNVLLDEEGRAHLADFGLARDAMQREENTVAGAGTPGYMSPEQAEGRPVTGRSDLCSLGLLVYRMLSGREPPPLARPPRHLHRRPGETRPALPALHASLPDAVNHVLRKATAVNPQDRHASARELVEELAAALGAPRPGAATPRPVTGDPTTAELHNPYKGLRAFEEGDAADFFGREALVDRLLSRLGGGAASADTTAGPLGRGRVAPSRFLAVVGPSGCGKSSVVKAGLLPALRRGALKGSERWFVLEVVPGAHPLEELERGLVGLAVGRTSGLMDELRRDERGLVRTARLALAAGVSAAGSTPELLLVVDQFEEVYTMADDRAEARQFVAALAAAATDPKSSVRVVITLRADYYDRPLLDPAMGALLSGATEVVVPMGPDELGRAIEEPALRAGLRFEPGLVAAIAADFGPERGTLPLLQYALTGLFEQREARVLTRAGYRATGGVAGALAARAEEVHAALDEEGREAARQLFLRLVTPGESGEGVRRRVRRAELESLGAPVGRAIAPFERARLLSLDRDQVTRGATVEVAHEALLREWPRLGRWLDAHRADIRLERLLGAAAGEWREAGADPSFLLEGARLAQFEGMRGGELELTTDERAFLEASLERRRRGEEQAEERRRSELEETRRRLRRSRAIAAVFVTLSVVAAALAGAAFSAQRRAREALAKVEPFKDIAALEEVRADYGAFFADPPPADEVEGRVRALAAKSDRLAERLAVDRTALAGVSAAENPRLRASLGKLVADLEALASGDLPYAARRRTAAMVASVGTGDNRRKWAAAREAIARSPRYAGMPPLEPQVGLVPLGEDAASGLWEFAHLPSGDVPGWRDGHAVRSAEMSVVLVLLPAREFWMGAQREDPQGRNYDVDAEASGKPVHAVTFARPFFLAKYELTQRQWHALMGTEPSWFRKGGGGKLERDDPLRPVEQVSWEDCRELVRASGLRLPSEAEWELGARGGTATPYSFGEDPALLAEHEWYAANANGGSNPVGEKKPNAFGLHDVQGNLLEWCEDGWSDDYGGAPADGSAASPSGAFRRAVRGGSFVNSPRQARASDRDGVAPDFRSRYVGVRLARSLSPR